MSDKTILAEHSYKELVELSHHFHHYGPIPIIIGGWAVFFYNSYLGSIDIDIVGPGMDGHLIYILTDFQGKNGYEEVSKSVLGLEKTYKKPIIENGEFVGDMEIDACTYEQDFNTFHEDRGKVLPYSLCDNPGMLEKITLNEVDDIINIPNKSLLFLYKIKAFRDRSFDVENKRAILSEAMITWLEGKVIKDGSDIISLLDPNPSQFRIKQNIDINIIKKIIKDFKLEFILETVDRLHENKLSMKLYSKADEQTIRAWTDTILKQM
jgi:hypothetical protein